MAKAIARLQSAHEGKDVSKNLLLAQRLVRRSIRDTKAGEDEEDEDDDRAHKDESELGEDAKDARGRGRGRGRGRPRKVNRNLDEELGAAEERVNADIEATKQRKKEEEEAAKDAAEAAVAKAHANPAAARKAGAFPRISLSCAPRRPARKESQQQARPRKMPPHGTLAKEVVTATWEMVRKRQQKMYPLMAR